jgi:hypothetical protein
MPDEPFLISFPGASTAQANRYASDLAATLRYLDERVVAEQRRDREEAQDFGATLALILGTASATAIANGMANWLARHSGARIEITAKGKVLATNLDSRDAAKIALAFSRSE